MFFKDLYNMFTPATKENFPKKCCTIQNNLEKNVFDSDEKYVCLIADTYKKSRMNFRIKVMKPYICEEENGWVTFGWVDEDDIPYSNLENSVRLVEECVVGFKRYEENKEEDDLWDYFCESLESQWE